ncbi:MAG: hypothetical protein QNJ70_07815 [Xenococcaceae cyanobacterium MO_207.B15]|nr:hypothetical protein [Xenococcaceae cyanobacterium MO_207.B15]
MINSGDGKCLLVAGGALDPNLTRLIEIANHRQVSVCDLRHGLAVSPSCSWHLTEAQPRIKAQVRSISGAFIRYDVFNNMRQPRSGTSQRALAWYQTLYGWLLSQNQIRLFNRHQTSEISNKLVMLILAKKFGLLIPDTWITNEAEQLAKYSVATTVAKPVAGGSFCYSLEELQGAIQFSHGCAAMPAIVQNRLVAPEVRIYVIGNDAFAFEIRSQHLDYRVKQDAEVIPLATLPQEVKLLRKLMAALQMDFGAADFKSDPQTKELVFLELNSAPMFVKFDQVLDGALCDAIIKALTIL